MDQGPSSPASCFYGGQPKAFEVPKSENKGHRSLPCPFEKPVLGDILPLNMEIPISYDGRQMSYSPSKPVADPTFISSLKKSFFGD